MKKITQSLEDYLEAIYIFSKNKKVARVRDISIFLNVKTPSVVGAIKTLSKKNLVKHEKYGYIELTEEGEKQAIAIFEKHRIISNFLHKILGIKKEIADEDACILEHNINSETYERMITFFEFLETCPENEPAFIKNFHSFIKTGKRPECRTDHASNKNIVKLSQLKIGEKGIIQRIHADNKIRRKMLVLGIIKGEIIEFVQAAPLGDPINYKIKDYNLSLRIAEAKLIDIEIYSGE